MAKERRDPLCERYHLSVVRGLLRDGTRSTPSHRVRMRRLEGGTSPSARTVGGTSRGAAGTAGVITGAGGAVVSIALFDAFGVARFAAGHAATPWRWMRTGEEGLVSSGDGEYLPRVAAWVGMKKPRPPWWRRIRLPRWPRRPVPKAPQLPEAPRIPDVCRGARANCELCQH
ncbi:MAG TPA: hypothetical protein VLH79_13540, partial [Chthonomonadales bacterium]|nr:hypothetical protein [Chthonomonadales bacterium]